MNVINASSSHHIAARPSSALPAIFAAGLLADVLDIAAAFVTWVPQGVPPVRILQGIASGLLGPQAFKEGIQTVLLALESRQRPLPVSEIELTLTSK